MVARLLLLMSGQCVRQIARASAISGRVCLMMSYVRHAEWPVQRTAHSVLASDPTCAMEATR